MWGMTMAEETRVRDWEGTGRRLDSQRNNYDKGEQQEETGKGLGDDWTLWGRRLGGDWSFWRMIMASESKEETGMELGRDWKETRL